MENTDQSLSTPLKIGIITGMVYCVLIFLQNQYFFKNPLQFSIIKFLFYLIIIGGIFYTGLLSKKQLGGYITFQQCLKVMLLAIVIIELFYLVFSTIYVKYIDPDFFLKLKSAWQEFFMKMNMPQDKINDSLQKFNDAGKITFWGLVQSYGFSIIIDAVFACIIAAILKKQEPLSEN